jgi:hypothetical protein
MKDNPQVYEGTGKTFEEAIDQAHSQIPPRPGRDFAIAKVIEFGMQRGGFLMAKLFYAKVVEDENAPFKSG